MEGVRRALFCGLVILISLPLFAQQTDINRYTLFTGFDYMISPARNLTERGFETDFGVDVNVSQKIGIRFAADWVNTHLFSNLLTPRQNYVRFSLGPTFRGGPLKMGE